MKTYQNVVITPTYNKHFKYISKYLQSFDKWLIDRDLPFYFIISKSEYAEFQQIIKPYKDKLNINILFIEDLFQKYGVDKTPDEVLNIFGSYSFQTLKKFYACLAVAAEHALILDSESMLIKPTNMTKLFNDYFENPRFFVSKNSLRPSNFFSSISYKWTEQTATFFEIEPDYWVIEGFEWFYDIKILQDLFKDHGMPYDIVKNMQNLNNQRNAIRVDVLEALLYYQYLIKHHKKYGYKMLIVQKEMQKFLGKVKYDDFINKFNASMWVYTGIMENFLSFVSKDNEKEFNNFINHHKICILRSNAQDRNLPSQKYVTDSGCVKIMAASQDHGLGLNFSPGKYWIHKLDIVQNVEKLNRYTKRFFLDAIPAFIKWLLTPLEILRELVICVVKIVRYILGVLGIVR